MDRCLAAYNAYAIYKTVKSDVLETNDAGQLYRYCFWGKLFFRVVDLVTQGAFSQTRHVRVHAAVQKTFDDLASHLEKCAKELATNPAFIGEVESHLYTYSIDTAQKEAVGKKPYRLLAKQLDNLTDLKTMPSIKGAERIAQLVNEIQTIATPRKLNDEGTIGPIPSV